MNFKDFFFSYKLILKSIYRERLFFKAFRKIFNYPYKYLLYKTKIFFLIDKINLDVDRPSSYLKDNVLKNTNDLKLDDFFIYFNSDKGSKVFWARKKIVKGHNYSDLYEKYFSRFKNKKNLKILEIGSEFGSSAASFLNYFDSATVCCLDKNPFQIKYFSKKIRKIFVDTKSEEVLSDVSKYIKYNFDIIIDDASHSKRDQIITLNKFLPKLENDGIYVVEDTCEYLIHPVLNDDKLNYGINEFLKGIIETGDHLSSYLDISEKKKIQNSIKNINFEKGNFIYNNQSLPEIVFIEKK